MSNTNIRIVKYLKTLFLLNLMTNYTKIAVKGASTIFGVSLLAGLIGYLVRFVFARNLTVEEFGLFYSVLSFLGMFVIFKSFGLDLALVKFIPEFQHKKQFDRIKSSIIFVAIFQVITNCIFLLAIYFLAGLLGKNFFKYENADVVLIWMTIATLIDSIVNVIKFSMQGFKEMHYYSGIDLIRMILILAISFFAFKLNLKFASPIIAYLIAPIIIIIIFGFILINKVFPEFRKSNVSIDKDLAKKLWHYGIFIMITTVGGMILGYTDTMVLTAFTSLSAVGLYNAALPTANFLTYFPKAIAAILLPLTSELWAKNKKKELNTGMTLLYRYSIITIVPLVLIMVSFPNLILTLFFGPDYVPASDALIILSIGMVLTPLYVINGNFFSGIGKPQLHSKIVFSGAIINLIMNLILIPFFGIIGAAITTSLSNIVMFIIGLAYMKKYIEVKFPFKTGFYSLLAGGFFTISIWFLKNILSLNVWVETIITITISGSLYIVLILILKIINIKEIKEITNRIIK